MRMIGFMCIRCVLCVRTIQKREEKKVIVKLASVVIRIHTVYGMFDDDDGEMMMRMNYEL